ncbi:MAG: hypothetical protein AAGI70_11665 [Pseudomonadota bacterium]
MTLSISHLASLPMPTAAQVIGVLSIKLAALVLAVSISEERGRNLIPVFATAYAVVLPLLLWVFGP